MLYCIPRLKNDIIYCLYFHHVYCYDSELFTYFLTVERWTEVKQLQLRVMGLSGILKGGYQYLFTFNFSSYNWKNEIRIKHTRLKHHPNVTPSIKPRCVSMYIPINKIAASNCLFFPFQVQVTTPILLSLVLSPFSFNATLTMGTTLMSFPKSTKAHCDSFDSSPVIHPEQ